MEKLLYSDLSYRVRGCAFKVYNVLGFGHKESIYQKALALEFKKENIKFEREPSLQIIYQDKKIGTYKPDFLVEDKVILEVKAVPVMPKTYETQLTYYLKSTNFKLGFVINFGSKKLDIRRRVWTTHYKNPR